MRKIDIYIIKKVLGTYFLSILMIISIAIVIDITEKMDDFYNEELTTKMIIMDYYIHFVPYYINLFSSMFSFISVVFVTSKLAFNSEIIAMLAGGISLRRIMVPYFISAAIIGLISFGIGSYVIPIGNNYRLDFESKYIDHEPPKASLSNVELKVSENEIAYIERFSIVDSIGYRFSLDRFENKTLVSRITANSIAYDSIDTWTVNKYIQRNFTDIKEELITGDTMQLKIAMNPKDFVVVKKHEERLTNSELRAFIKESTERGRGGLNGYKLEYQKRYSMPFGAFILTLIGVSVACRKSRGGTGLHMLIGMTISVVYIVFTLVSSTLTVQGGWNPTIAIWTPNVVFLIIGWIMYRVAPK